MIHDQDRSGWFGASDTATIMGSWDTETFRRWWAVKLGIRQDHYTNAAMQAGTAYEHKILDALGVKTRDRQIKVYALRLRVNYDGDDAQTVTEVKTYSKAPFKVSRAYWMQCQVEMFASGGACGGGKPAGSRPIRSAKRRSRTSFCPSTPAGSACGPSSTMRRGWRRSICPACGIWPRA